MSAVNDMRTELRKLADSKPVHAAAGAGAVASEALRELPGRLAKWRTETEHTVTALPQRAQGYYAEVRTRAIHEYDRLATRGAKVLNGKATPKGKSALNGKTTK